MFIVAETNGVAMYNALINRHCTDGNMEKAYEIMVEMKKRIFPDNVTCNTLMRESCLLGQLDEARILIDEMTKRSTAISHDQGNFSISVWDPGGHKNSSLGTSCILRWGECQIYRWAVGHDGPGLHLYCSILQEEKNTHELRGREQTTIPSSSISVFLLGSC